MQITDGADFSVVCSDLGAGFRGVSSLALSSMGVQPRMTQDGRLMLARQFDFFAALLIMPTLPCFPLSFASPVMRNSRANRMDALRAPWQTRR